MSNLKIHYPKKYWTAYGNQSIYRFHGLDYILHRAKGKTVLDLGAATGMISFEFSKYGASVVHGFDSEEQKVAAANKLFSDEGVKNVVFRKANLADIPEFTANNSDVLLPQYDIVLMLGLHLHLWRSIPDEEKERRRPVTKNVIQHFLARAERWFVVRGSQNAWTPTMEELKRRIEVNGFILRHERHATEGILGWIGTYERRA